MSWIPHITVASVIEKEKKYLLIELFFVAKKQYEKT